MTEGETLFAADWSVPEGGVVERMRRSLELIVKIATSNKGGVKSPRGCAVFSVASVLADAAATAAAAAAAAI